MLKLFLVVMIIAALVGMGLCVLRKIATKSTPVALAIAIVLAAFIAPVQMAHAVVVLVIVALVYIALV